MSQSITIIGGNTSVSGLVTVPLDVNFNVSNLQSLLGMSGASGSIVGGSLALANVNAVSQGLSGNFTIPANTTGLPGVVELTNTDPNGSVFGGSSVTGYTTRVPEQYSTLIDQLPGSGVIRGNSSQNFLAIFGKNANATFVPEGGSGTVIAGGSGDLISTNGLWSIDGSSDGGDTINSNGTGTIYTYGQGAAPTSTNGFNLSGNTPPSNVVGLLGGSNTVIAGGTADLVEGYSASNDVVSVTSSSSVSASAVILVSGGNVTVDAASSSSNVKAFFQTGGNLYFVNQSTVQGLVGGDAPNATGGSATVFGGIGGGVFKGGSGGSNSLIGGFAPGQASTAGGAGLVTLVGSSSNNFLEATGSIVGGGNTQNELDASNGISEGTATLVATGTTSVNTFNAIGASKVNVTTSGAGAQTFYMINNGGNETVSGSTVAGATDTYILTESDANGLGNNTDVLTNFRIGQDLLTVSGGGSSIQSAQSITGGSQLNLSDGTRIQLIGVTYNAATFASYVGKSSI